MAGPVGQVMLLCSLLVAYKVTRSFGGNDVQDVRGAFRYAGDLLRLEGWLHLPGEQGVQQLLLRSDLAARLADEYYRFAHLLVTAAALMWLFVRHRRHYRWARSGLVSVSVVGVTMSFLLPLAPPRMMNGRGFVDVGRQFHLSIYGPPRIGGWVNQYSAMPSLHVAWAVLVAAVCIGAASGALRWIWVTHPLITLLVVVATGNHYWLDAIVAAALVGAALVLIAAPAGPGPIHGLRAPPCPPAPASGPSSHVAAEPVVAAE